MSDRAAALERMLVTRPDDPRILFGLALEYLGVGRFEEAVTTLRRYLSAHDDEGNAWGRLAGALRALGREDEARAALEAGITAAERHAHPTLAEELRGELDR